MREIKFRAWHAGHEHAAPQMLYDEKPGDCLVWKSQGQNITHVMQYTGLKDRNDREIYEGDITKYCYAYKEKIRNFTAYVEWIEELLCYCLKNMDGTWKSEINRYDFRNNSEIIGNIYENPELLP